MDNIITFVSFCSSVKLVLFSSYQQQPQLVSCCKICTDIKARFSKLPKKKTNRHKIFIFLSVTPLKVTMNPDIVPKKTKKNKKNPKKNPQKTNNKMNLPIHFIQ